MDGEDSSEGSGFRATNLDVDQFNAYLRKNRAEFEQFSGEMELQRQ